MSKPSQWFYFRDGTAHGPFSSKEMRRLARTGRLLESDLLWKPGMERQRPARESTNLWRDWRDDGSGSERSDIEPDMPDVGATRSPRVVAGATLVGVALVLVSLLVVVALSLQHSRSLEVVPASATTAVATAPASPASQPTAAAPEPSPTTAAPPPAPPATQKPPAATAATTAAATRPATPRPRASRIPKPRRAAGRPDDDF